MSDTAKQIYTLIPRIMGEIGHVAKGRIASMGERGGKFAFRGIDDAYAALQPLLAANGVFIVPRVTECKRETVTNDRGGARTTTVVTVEFDVTAPDGSFVTTRMVGESMDSGDKSASKAQSVAMREMVWKLFCVPTAATDNDPESANDSHGNGHAAPQPPAPPKAPDLSDATVFRTELGRAFASRHFSPDDMKAAADGICDHYKVTMVGAIPAERRAAIIAGIAKGNLDRFKAAAKATPAQVTEINELLAVVKLPDGTAEKWLGAAGVESFEEMKAADVAACINRLKQQQPATTTAA